MNQQFKTVNVLRLEVEANPTGLPNYVRNVDGTLGGWGYLTPKADTQVADGGSNSGAFANTPSLYFSNFSASIPGAIAPFLTEPTPVTAGRSCGGRLDLQTFDLTVAARLEFYDAAGSVIGTGAQSTTVAANSSTTTPVTLYAPVTAAPAGSVAFSLRLDTQRVVPGTGNGKIGFKNVMVTHAATTLGSTYTYVPPIVWTNILGPTHDIKVDRSGLDPGVLTATVYDATLDPATNDSLRPGKAVRLITVTSLSPLTYGEPIFNGTINNAQVTYDLAQPKVNNRAKITLSAIDNVAKLANVVRPNGYAISGGFPTVALSTSFEGAGVPWALGIQGEITAQANFTPTLTAVTKGASLLDQVVLMRDAVRGYAWCDSYGAIHVQSQADTPTTGTPAYYALLDENVYTDLNVDWNSADCINVVTLKVRRPNLATGESVDVSYGPYRDQASVDRWGAYSAEFTVQGAAFDTEAAASAYAAAILTANATPMVRINGLRLPVVTTADLSTTQGSRRALLDLYQAVRVKNTDGGIDETSLITGITHTLTAGARGSKWLVDLSFAATVSSAPPQTVQAATGGVVAAGALPAATDWTTLPYSAGWSAFASGNEVPQYKREGNKVYLRGVLLVSTGASLASLAVLPTGFRPLLTAWCSASVNGTPVYAAVSAAGVISVGGSSPAVGSFVSLHNTMFHLD